MSDEEEVIPPIAQTKKGVAAKKAASSSSSSSRKPRAAAATAASHVSESESSSSSSSDDDNNNSSSSEDYESSDSSRPHRKAPAKKVVGGKGKAAAKKSAGSKKASRRGRKSSDSDSSSDSSDDDDDRDRVVASKKKTSGKSVQSKASAVSSKKSKAKSKNKKNDSSDDDFSSSSDDGDDDASSSSSSSASPTSRLGASFASNTVIAEFQKKHCSVPVVSKEKEQAEIEKDSEKLLEHFTAVDKKRFDTETAKAAKVQKRYEAEAGPFLKLKKQHEAEVAAKRVEFDALKKKSDEYWQARWDFVRDEWQKVDLIDSIRMYYSYPGYADSHVQIPLHRLPASVSDKLKAWEAARKTDRDDVEKRMNDKFGNSHPTIRYVDRDYQYLGKQYKDPSKVEVPVVASCSKHEIAKCAASAVRSALREFAGGSSYSSTVLTLRENVVVPAAATNVIPTFTDSKCGCLFPVSACFYADPRRAVLKEACSRQEVIPVVPAKDSASYIVKKSGKYDDKKGEQPHEFKGFTRRIQTAFTDLFGSKIWYRDNIHFFSFSMEGHYDKRSGRPRWQWDPNAHGPGQTGYVLRETTLLRFRGVSDVEVTTQNANRTLPKELLEAKVVDIKNGAQGSEVTFYWDKAKSLNCTPAHAKHQLYVLLRSMTGSDGAVGKDFEASGVATLSFNCLAKTKDQLWTSRFAVDAVVRALMPGENRDKKPAFGSLMTALPTPQLLYSMASSLHRSTSKELLDELGPMLTREGIKFDHVPLRPPGVTVDLFPHQRRAIAFMLDREKNGLDLFVTSPIIKRGAGGKDFRYFINMAFGAILAVDVGSEMEKEILAKGKHRGGILADSVGLGKTLDCISLIILNPPQDAKSLPKIVEGTPIHFVPPIEKTEKDYDAVEKEFVNSCNKKLKIKATLVIAPVSLVVQWEEEIAKRAPNLKVLRYHGAQKKKATYAQFCDADIVITTYETLKLRLRDELFWCKWFFWLRGGGASLWRDPSAVGALSRVGYAWGIGPNGANEQVWFSYEDAQTIRSISLDMKDLLKKKFITGKASPPPASEPWLSRISFHRCVMDEFHKQGGLSDCDLPDSSFTWLVSGTPLDAPFSVASKRMGLFDFSFVDPSRLSFVVDNIESRIPHPLDPSYLEKQLQRVHRQLPKYFSLIQSYVPYTPPASGPCSYAKLAVLSSLCIRNTLETCPELKAIKLHEYVVKIKHTEEERAKYKESAQIARNNFNALVARGAVHTHMLEVIQTLNSLRKSAIDPLGNSIKARNALVLEQNLSVDQENERRNVRKIPVDVLSHIMFPKDFALPPTEHGDPKDARYAFASKYSTQGSLKDDLTSMQKVPPELPLCSICLEDVMNPVVLQCAHVYCRECVCQWLRNSGDGACPNCRKKTLDDKTPKALLSFPIIEREAARRRAEEEAEQNAANADREAQEKQELRRKKSVQEEKSEEKQFELELCGPKAPKRPSKILQVMRIIREAMKKDTTVKFVVFTAFPTAIPPLVALLKNFNIGTAIIDGTSSLTARGRLIESFMDESNYQIRCMILSSRVGNAGLTLIAANHLILLEPCTSLDVDVQTLGRIRRIGQKRECHIHRLLCEDTLEVPLYNMVKKKSLALGAKEEAERKKAVERVKLLLNATGEDAGDEDEDDDEEEKDEDDDEGEDGEDGAEDEEGGKKKKKIIN